MTLVDQFESVFRSAERSRYAFSAIDVKKVLLVTDLEGEEAERFAAKTRAFLAEIEGASWAVLTNDDYNDVAALRTKVTEMAPDLVVNYRNLRYTTWRWPYSLGVYLNVLTRETDLPVLVMPNPHELPD